MSGAALPIFEPMTIEGFLRFLDDRPDEEHWELRDGEPVMMVGGTAAHALIGGNIEYALNRRLRGGPCRPMHGFFACATAHDLFEPDVFVRCGPIDPIARLAEDAVVVFEVLSPSTMRFDRGRKLDRYREIATLRQVVFVYQDSVRVESFDRADHWRDEPTVLAERGEMLALPALSVQIALEEIYGDVTPVRG